MARPAHDAKSTPNLCPVPHGMTKPVIGSGISTPHNVRILSISSIERPYLSSPHGLGTAWRAYSSGTTQAACRHLRRSLGDWIRHWAQPAALSANHHSSPRNRSGKVLTQQGCRPHRAGRVSCSYATDRCGHAALRRQSLRLLSSACSRCARSQIRSHRCGNVDASYQPAGV